MAFFDSFYVLGVRLPLPYNEAISTQSQFYLSPVFIVLPPFCLAPFYAELDGGGVVGKGVARCGCHVVSLF